MVNKRVSIIGMGMLGRAWSIAFARAGCTVIGWDPSTEASNASLKVVDQLLAELDRRNFLKTVLLERAQALIAPFPSPFPQAIASITAVLRKK